MTHFLIDNAPTLSVLTVNESLALHEGLTQFTVEPYRLHFDYAAFLAAPLDTLDVPLTLGVMGRTGRGFTLRYLPATNQYEVTLPSPATTADWEVFLEFTLTLVNYTHGAIAVGDGLYFEGGLTSEDLIDWNWREDVLLGLLAMKRALQTAPTLALSGCQRDVSFNRAMLNAVLQSDDPVRAFSERYTEAQYPDAMISDQGFYKQETTDDIIGIYSLTQDQATVIPKEPVVETKHEGLLKNTPVTDWKMMFVLYDSPSDRASFRTKTMSYSRFIELLPKEKYQWLDGGSILVHALSQDDIKAFLSQQ